MASGISMAAGNIAADCCATYLRASYLPTFIRRLRNLCSPPFLLAVMTYAAENIKAAAANSDIVAIKAAWRKWQHMATSWRAAARHQAWHGVA